jgi:hypothetical protein
MDLAIDECKTGVEEKAGKTQESYSRGTRFEAEHGFAEKSLPQTDSIQTANENIILPYFDRVCISKGMEQLIGFPHGREYPGAFLVLSSDSGTGVDNVRK